jgi:methionyl-tRNA formyltransferase
VYQPEKIRTNEVAVFLRSLRADAMAVVAYGKIIPQEIIDIPILGLVNVHASLLPRFRGAAPIQWAVAEGETVTGATTMLIDAGLDTGDILLASETPIGPDETAVSLSERLAVMGADLLVETLRGIERGTVVPRPQEHSRATLAPMLTKESGIIDWRWNSVTIHNRVRGFQPWPGAHTTHRGRTLHIWASRLADLPAFGPPGTLHPDRHRLFAACGEGSALELIELQIEGRNRIPAAGFINGQRLAGGERLGETVL